MMPTRNHIMVSGLDHSRMKGVEIGPWYNPIAPKSSGWMTTIVDFSTGDELRARARTHSAPDIRRAERIIEDVDVVWIGQPLDEPLLKINPDGYDFLIASHVLEHLPDLIGFFSQLRNIIKPDGIVSLAMPDMRFCFDFFKPLTMTDAVLLASRQGRTRHSAETIFSAVAYQAWLEGKAAWHRHDIPAVNSVGPIRVAYALYIQELKDQVGQSSYVDAHGWVFVPASFSLVFLELNALGLIDFRIKSIIDGEGSEFFVQLEPGRVQLTDEEIELERGRLLKLIVEELAVRVRSSKSRDPSDGVLDEQSVQA